MSGFEKIADVATYFSDASFFIPILKNPEVHEIKRTKLVTPKVMSESSQMLTDTGIRWAKWFFNSVKTKTKIEQRAFRSEHKPVVVHW